MASPSAGSEDDLPIIDGSVIVRGGTLRVSDLEKALEKAEYRLKRPGVSVLSSQSGTARQILDEAPLKNPQISLSTAGDLWRAGFSIERTGDPRHHHTVWFSANWRTTGEIGQFRTAFTAPVWQADL